MWVTSYYVAPFHFLYPVLCRWKSGESAWKVAMTRSFRFEFCQSIQLTKPDSVQPFIENKFQIRQVIIDSMSVIPVLVLHKAVVVNQGWQSEATDGLKRD